MKKNNDFVKIIIFLQKICIPNNSKLELLTKIENMKKQKTFFLIFLLWGFSLALTQAQTNISAIGGDASGSGGSVSYSIGQVVYTTNTGTNGSVAQGVQQPYEISVVSTIEEAKGINLMVSAYPNPTTDYLILDVPDFDLLTFAFHLYDMQGKLLQNEIINDSHTRIAMNNLATAVYFVKVFQNNKEVKTFKIIKN